MERILLVGGAGFIASHIAEHYLALGHEVIIVDDLSTGYKKKYSTSFGTANVAFL